MDIEWIAEEMINYDSNPEKRNNQIDKFNNHILTHLSNYENAPKKDLYNLVFFVTADFTMEISDPGEKAKLMDAAAYQKYVEGLSK